MNDIILYNDCDGVIFDTIDVAYGLMQEQGCNMMNRSEIDYYFRKMIDWNEVFKKAHIINNAFEKIIMLKESKAFKDIKILTSLSGGYYEEELKRFIFGENLPNFKVITVQYGIPKALIVPDIERSILVDDEKRNCLKYEKYDGTAIQFTKDTVDLENNIINDLLDIPNTSGYKKLIKTRNF